MKLMMRVLGSTATILLVASGISTSCSKSPAKEPETPSEEQQRMQEPKTGGADGSTAAPSGGGEQSMQGEYGGQQYQGQLPAQEQYQGQQPGQEQYGGTMPATIPESSQAARSDIHALSTARCDREMRCNNVGSGKKYESTDECTQKLDSRGYDDLGPGECKSGIRKDKLDTCLSAIRSERCGSPLDTLTRLVSCRSAALCAD